MKDAAKRRRALQLLRAAVRTLRTCSVICFGVFDLTQNADLHVVHEQSDTLLDRISLRAFPVCSVRKPFSYLSLKRRVSGWPRTCRSTLGSEDLCAVDPRLDRA